MNEEFKAPEVDADVNYVASSSQKIHKLKVVAVVGDGRIVTVEVPTSTKNRDGEVVNSTQKLNVGWRPKSKPAGNTWHHALVAALLLLALAFVPMLKAALPTYHTLSAYGNGITPAGVIFPADPNLQIRLINLFWSADTNAASLNCQSGTTAFTLGQTNYGMTTNLITATNGLAASTTVMLQHAGAVYTNTTSSWINTGTNTLTLAGVTVTNTTTTLGQYGNGPVGVAATNLNYLVTTGAWPVNAAIGDEIYIGGPITSIPLGAGTNSINGDDIFSGNYGRPLFVWIAGYNPAVSTSANTNRLSSISTHYDSQSQ